MSIHGEPVPSEPKLDWERIWSANQENIRTALATIFPPKPKFSTEENKAHLDSLLENEKLFLQKVCQKFLLIRGNNPGKEIIILWDIDGTLGLPTSFGTLSDLETEGTCRSVMRPIAPILLSALSAYGSVEALLRQGILSSRGADETISRLQNAQDDMSSVVEYIDQTQIHNTSERKYRSDADYAMEEATLHDEFSDILRKDAYTETGQFRFNFTLPDIRKMRCLEKLIEQNAAEGITADQRIYFVIDDMPYADYFNDKNISGVSVSEVSFLYDKADDRDNSEGTPKERMDRVARARGYSI